MIFHSLEMMSSESRERKSIKLSERYWLNGHMLQSSRGVGSGRALIPSGTCRAGVSFGRCHHYMLCLTFPPLSRERCTFRVGLNGPCCLHVINWIILSLLTGSNLVCVGQINNPEIFQSLLPLDGQGPSLCDTETSCALRHQSSVSSVSLSSLASSAPSACDCSHNSLEWPQLLSKPLQLLENHVPLTCSPHTVNTCCHGAVWRSLIAVLVSSPRGKKSNVCADVPVARCAQATSRSVCQGGAGTGPKQKNDHRPNPAPILVNRL